MEARQTPNQTLHVGEVDGKPVLFVHTEIATGRWGLRRYALTEIPWTLEDKQKPQPKDTDNG